MSRILRVVLVVLVAVVLLAGGAVGLAWWKLNSLKEQLREGLAKSLGADVQVDSLEIDPFKSELHAAGITLTNQRSSAPWEKGAIAQATVRYKFSDLFSSPIPLTVEITSWSVVLHSPLRTAETPPGALADDDSANSSPSHRVEVNHLIAHEGTVEMNFSDDRKATIRGVEFDSTKDGEIWTTQLQATSVEAGTLALGASSVKIRGESDKITFSDLRMQCDPGAITGEGEVATEGAHDAKLSLNAVNVPVTMLLALAWQPAITGFATIDLTYTGNDQGGTATGSVSLAHAKFNVLPWLSKVTSLVGLPDISGVEVDKATSDYIWKNGALHLANIDVRKNDVARFAGDVDIDPQGNVDGHLKLGLPSAVTSKWPQLQTSVFSTQLEDYNWADVHITGTANQLQEDLTQRVVAAGLNQGTDVLKQATQGASNLLNSLLGK
jgi:hypothetical protein